MNSLVTILNSLTERRSSCNFRKLVSSAVDIDASPPVQQLVLVGIPSEAVMDKELQQESQPDVLPPSQDGKPQVEQLGTSSEGQEQVENEQVQQETQALTLNIQSAMSEATLGKPQGPDTEVRPDIICCPDIAGVEPDSAVVNQELQFPQDSDTAVQEPTPQKGSKPTEHEDEDLPWHGAIEWNDRTQGVHQGFHQLPVGVKYVSPGVVCGFWPRVLIMKIIRRELVMRMGISQDSDDRHIKHDDTKSVFFQCEPGDAFEALSAIFHAGLVGAVDLSKVSFPTLRFMVIMGRVGSIGLHGFFTPDNFDFLDRLTEVVRRPLKSGASHTQRPEGPGGSAAASQNDPKPSTSGILKNPTGHINSIAHPTRSDQGPMMAVVSAVSNLQVPQPTNQDRGFTWRGAIVWKDSTSTDRRLTAVLKCDASEVICGPWRRVLSMNFLRKEVLNRLGQSYIDHSMKVVTLQCEPGDSLEALIQHLNAGFVGSLQVNSVRTPFLSRMLVVCREGSRTIQGLIPKDNFDFIDRLIIRRSSKAAPYPQRPALQAGSTAGGTQNDAQPSTSGIQQNPRDVRQNINEAAGHAVGETRIDHCTQTEGNSAMTAQMPIPQAADHRPTMFDCELEQLVLVQLPQAQDLKAQKPEVQVQHAHQLQIRSEDLPQNPQLFQSGISLAGPPQPNISYDSRMSQQAMSYKPNNCNHHLLDHLTEIKWEVQDEGGMPPLQAQNHFGQRVQVVADYEQEQLDLEQTQGLQSQQLEMQISHTQQLQIRPEDLQQSQQLFQSGISLAGPPQPNISYDPGTPQQGMSYTPNNRSHPFHPHATSQPTTQMPQNIPWETKLNLIRQTRPIYHFPNSRNPSNKTKQMPKARVPNQGHSTRHIRQPHQQQFYGYRDNDDHRYHK